MTELERKRKFPIAFWVCGCTEIFERLSFYLGRSLILVFVTTAVASGGLGLANNNRRKDAGGFNRLFISCRFPRSIHHR